MTVFSDSTTTTDVPPNQPDPKFIALITDVEDCIQYGIGSFPTEESALKAGSQELKAVNKPGQPARLVTTVIELYPPAPTNAG